MKTFEITLEVNDPCGNSKVFHLGYAQFADQATAEVFFPKGVFVHYKATEVVPTDPKKLVEQVSRGFEKGHYR